MREETVAARLYTGASAPHGKLGAMAMDLAGVEGEVFWCKAVGPDAEGLARFDDGRNSHTYRTRRIEPAK